MSHHAQSPGFRRGRPYRSIAIAAGLSGVLLLAAACTGSSSPAAPSTQAAAQSIPDPTATPRATGSSTAPPRPAVRNPLTGIGPVPTHPVVAVKIDDTGPGRPQVGIDKADVVYIEAVEGGYTRLAAIFATSMPAEVGYVRSTRPSDPDLLLQYGLITEAYSGGAHDSLPRVRRSGITSWSNDAAAQFYARIDRPESAYINLALDVGKVAATTRTPVAHSIGWTFSPSLAGLHTSTGIDVRTTVTGSYSHGTAVEFRWDPALRAYVRYIDGVRQRAADGRPITATNVIVQSCRVVSHPRDTDINGNPSQFTYTVGTGRVSVFRQGRRVDGTWTRKRPLSGTTLLAAGKPLPLAPGNTWVVLVRNGVPTQG